MKEILIESASALHNWKQRTGVVRERASRNDKSLGSARRRLERLLATSITMKNYRALAQKAGMNSLDLVETVTEKLKTLGLVGLASAIQIHRAHGIVTCLQYLYAL